MQISVCLLIYRRLENIPRTLSALDRQTYRDFELVIWNNSGGDVSFPSLGYPVRVVGTPAFSNVGSIARFHMIPHVYGDLVVYLDDDAFPDPDFLSEVVRAHQEWPHDICGWFARQFNPKKPEYWKKTVGLRRGDFVDYLGTCGLFCRRGHLETPGILEMPSWASRAEDLYFSAFMSMRGVNLRYVPLPIRLEGNDDVAQFKELYSYKTNLFNQMRLQGWQFVKERK